MTGSDRPRANERLNWLFGIVEALLVLAALAFALIAAFLAPSQQETLATLASSRQHDLASAVALALLSLALAVAIELIRRRKA